MLLLVIVYLANKFFSLSLSLFYRLDQRSYSTLGPVSTGMNDRLPKGNYLSM